MSTLKKIDGRAYEYFKSAMRSTLRGEMGSEERMALEKMLANLEIARVRKKCSCGDKDCLTYDFEVDSLHEWVVDLVGGITENRGLIAFGTESGNLVTLEGYPLD